MAVEKSESQNRGRLGMRAKNLVKAARRLSESGVESTENSDGFFPVRQLVDNPPCLFVTFDAGRRQQSHSNL